MDDNPGSPTGSGVFYARVPAGSRAVATKVLNPSSRAAAMTVELNGKAGAPIPIEPGKEATIVAPIPDKATEIAIRFTGGKELILLQTEVLTK